MIPGPRAFRVALAVMEWARVPEDLIGDIAEERERGRSAAWLWRQTILAATSGLRREVATHPLTLLRGALTGLAACWLLVTVVTQPLVRAGWLTHAADWRGSHYVMLIVIGSASSGVASWGVARLHAAHRAAAVMGFLVAVVSMPLWKLPLVVRAYPFVYGYSIEPHIPFLLVSMLLVAPPSILLGGFWGSSRDWSPPGLWSHSS